MRDQGSTKSLLSRTSSSKLGQFTTAQFGRFDRDPLTFYRFPCKYRINTQGVRVRTLPRVHVPFSGGNPQNLSQGQRTNQIRTEQAKSILVNFELKKKSYFNNALTSITKHCSSPHPTQQPHTYYTSTLANLNIAQFTTSTWYL